jgi:hypothetical protein
MVNVEHIPTVRIGNDAMPRSDSHCVVAGQSLAKTILTVTNSATIISFLAIQITVGFIIIICTKYANISVIGSFRDGIGNTST